MEEVEPVQFVKSENHWGTEPLCHLQTSRLGSLFVFPEVARPVLTKTHSFRTYWELIMSPALCWVLESQQMMIDVVLELRKHTVSEGSTYMKEQRPSHTMNDKDGKCGLLWEQLCWSGKSSVNNEMGSLGKRLSPSSFDLHAQKELPHSSGFHVCLGLVPLTLHGSCLILVFCHLVGECVGGTLKNECLKENLSLFLFPTISVCVFPLTQASQRLTRAK